MVPTEESPVTLRELQTQVREIREEHELHAANVSVLQQQRDRALRRVIQLEHDNWRLELELQELTFMTKSPLTLGSFRLVELATSYIDGLAFTVRCTEAGHPDPERVYNLFVGLVEKATGPEADTFGQFDILASLPYHPNVSRYYRCIASTAPNMMFGFFPRYYRVPEAAPELDSPFTLVETRMYLQEDQTRSLELFMKKHYSDRPLERACLLRILKDVVRGVNHLRKHHLVHNEVSPRTVLIEPDERHPHRVRRAYLGHFESVCHTGPDHRVILSRADTDSIPDLWPDISFLAPELIDTSISASGLDVLVDYSGHYVFAVSALAYAILTSDPCNNFNAIYPTMLLDRDTCTIDYPLTAVPLLSSRLIEHELAWLLRTGLACDPANRPAWGDFSQAILDMSI